MYEKEEDLKYHFHQNLRDDLLNHIDNPTPWPHARNGWELNIYIGDNWFSGRTITKSLLTLNAGYSSIEYGILTSPARWTGNLVVFNMTREQLDHPEHGGYIRELQNHVNPRVSDMPLITSLDTTTSSNLQRRIHITSVKYVQVRCLFEFSASSWSRRF